MPLDSGYELAQNGCLTLIINDDICPFFKFKIPFQTAKETSSNEDIAHLK